VNALLGPLLLVAGLLLLELLQFSTGPLVKPETLQRWSERGALSSDGGPQQQDARAQPGEGSACCAEAWCDS